MFTAAEVAGATGGTWQVAPHDASMVFSRVATDSRADCAGALFVALAGERFDAHDHLAAAVAAGAAALCVAAGRLSGGLALPSGVPVLSVPDPLVAFQSLATAHRRRLADRLTVVALTGSSGKTSTKEILRAVLSAAHGQGAVLATEGNTNNHVGVPQNLLRLNESHRLAIIEMGISHHGEMVVLSRIAEPDLAIIVGIGSAHLEFLGDLDGVAREKSAIFSRLRPGGVAVIPSDGHGTATLVKAAGPARLLRFGEDEAADLRVEYLGGTLVGARMRLSWRGGPCHEVEWGVPGRHQARNAAATALAATALGMSPEAIVAGLAGCRLPGMRMRIRQVAGTTWVNDAYNANPDSVAAGLAWLGEAARAASVGRCFLCLGDMLELGPGGAVAHRGTLATARRLLPTAEILAIGPAMTAAVGELAEEPRLRAFPDAAAAAAWLNGQLTGQDNDALVYLKGSRGMALERIEPSAS
jgi:UDP-N-acetylmuramoyl-tripeptide--D-alanyl-D-alanine ligase